MFKTIMTVVVTIIGVLFAMQNFDHVPVYIFSGKAVNIRLIFVIAITGVIGYLIRHFIGISREEKLKRQIYITRRTRPSNGKKRNSIVEDEEL